jgi:hypothetical protein
VVPSRHDYTSPVSVHGIVLDRELGVFDEEVVVVDATAAACDLAGFVGTLLRNVRDEAGSFLLNLDNAVDEDEQHWLKVYFTRRKEGMRISRSG